MATVTDPSGTGTLGGVIIIDSLGRARVWVRPNDPRTAAQIRFRQLMRGLYTVLPKFSAPVDADLIALAPVDRYWSAWTFGEWAATHGTAIDDDRDHYGASYR
jgi:hypothetical protein